MAKIRTRNYGYYGDSRSIHVLVKVLRAPRSEGGDFKACAFLKLGTQNSAKTFACSFSKNPRAAIANALNAVAKKTRGRKGAFAGLGGSRKRRR